MNFRHIILTRFNLQFDPQSTIHIQETWLHERIRLFKQYCLPAIEQQTSHNFTWVLLASDHTPEHVKNLLLECTQSHSYIRVHFCPYTDNLNAMYKSIGQEYAIGYAYLLSTRMDNDDMLAANFVETLQAHLREPQNKFSFYTFPHGIQLFETDQQAFGVRFDRNHFLSLLEPTTDVSTCLGFDHTQVPTNQLIKLKEKAMWCEIVHNSNICNDYTPKYKYSIGIKNLLYPISFKPYTKKFLSQCIFLMGGYIRFRSRFCLRIIEKVFCGRAS